MNTITFKNLNWSLSSPSSSYFFYIFKRCISQFLLLFFKNRSSATILEWRQGIIGFLDLLSLESGYQNIRCWWTPPFVLHFFRRSPATQNLDESFDFIYYMFYNKYLIFMSHCYSPPTPTLHLSLSPCLSLFSFIMTNITPSYQFGVMYPLIGFMVADCIPISSSNHGYTNLQLHRNTTNNLISSC